MAPRKPSSSSPFPLQIGNCEVMVEAKAIACKSDPNTLEISINRNAKVKISVREELNRRCNDEFGPLIRAEHKAEEEQNCSFADDYAFVLVNPKDVDTSSKYYLQEALKVYARELPTMNYAANTGKQSQFLERCLSNGKYRTLLLKFKSTEGSGEVIAAITFQLVPSDTQYAEIPLAAVSSNYQNKGLGRLLYLELRKRLYSVGVRTVYCWGDKESEGFWLKQDFKSIAEVDSKGKARRLPIKADVRRALCFPGGSMLMVSQLNEYSSAKPADSLKKSEEDFGENTNLVGFSQHQDSGDSTPFVGGELSKMATGAALTKIKSSADVKWCCHNRLGAKRRSWEASWSSLKSKKVKGSVHIVCASDSNCDPDSDSDRIDPCNNACSLGVSKTSSRSEVGGANPLEISAKAEKSVNVPSEALASEKLQSTGECFRIMLMNIADDTKKRNLEKVIEKLGGSIVHDGCISTHVVTGKVRRTLNFCTAICSGAWIVSSSWLKESFRNSRFVDEAPHVLQDEDYALQYRTELRNAVLRARVKPGALLKGYNICIGVHVQPPFQTLAAIVRSAGGNVVSVLDEVKDASKAIFVACEEDMEEALLASMKGAWTFSSDWLMTCIMRQELDFGALKFAESL